MVAQEELSCIFMGGADRVSNPPWGFMLTVKRIALVCGLMVSVIGCEKGADKGASEGPFAIAAVVQCLEPTRPDQWTSQIVKWTSRVSKNDAIKAAARELGQKNICASRTNANLKDGLCWWIGLVDERPAPCTAGPPL